jgi:intraflagellar transport protein 80
MRLKFSFPPALRHTDRVDCVGWMSADDLYSVGEDHIIYKYNVVQNELIKIAELAQDLYPLDMHWLPKGASTSGGGQGSSSVSGGKRTLGSDLFVLATSDGKLRKVFPKKNFYLIFR